MAACLWCAATQWLASLVGGQFCSLTTAELQALPQQNSSWKISRAVDILFPRTDARCHPEPTRGAAISQELRGCVSSHPQLAWHSVSTPFPPPTILARRGDLGGGVAVRSHLSSSWGTAVPMTTLTTPRLTLMRCEACVCGGVMRGCVGVVQGSSERGPGRPCGGGRVLQ